MSYQEEGLRAFIPDAVYARGTRVKLNSAVPGTSTTPGGITVAGAGEDDIGVMWTNDPFGNLATPQTVRLNNDDGTVPMIASGAIAAGAEVYPAASGKISTTAAGNPIGRALAAASGDGSVIEVLRYPRTKNNPVNVPIVAASVDSYVYIADKPCRVTAVNLLPSVAGSDGSAVTVDVRKITDTSLPGAAAGASVIELLQTALNLKGTAGTVQTGTLSATASDLVLAKGDKLAINLTGTLTSVVALLSIELGN